MKLTPNLNSKGLYSLKAPFTLPAGKLYTCIAVRSFKDIYEQDLDVLDLYYIDNGLTEADFNADKALEAAIVTLVSDDNDFVYVPNTYILNMPDMNDVTYHNVILSVNLGALPEYVELDNLKDELAVISGKVIGKSATVGVNVTKTTGSISRSQHETLESVRLSAVEYNETLYARNIRQQALINELYERISLYEGILIDNNLVS